MIDIDQLALDTTEKVYAVDPAKLRGGDTQAKAIIQCLIYAAIQAAITRQANAAKRGMDAAKESGAHMEAEARRLYAECNPEALESERAANAQLTEDLQRTEAERDGWVESARHFANGQEFYQGLVRQVGNLFGEVAYTSDDGSVQDDVLALKVPELVEALSAHVEKGSRIVHEWALGAFGDVAAAQQLGEWLHTAPTTSLARLKAQWQAKGAQLTADSIRYEYEGEIHQDRIADHADEVADELRRQAEGGE